MRKIIFQSFEEARKFAQTLKISNQTDWRIKGRSGKFPDNIPRDPPSVYKKDWKGWGDWLRAGKKPERESTFLTFEEARTTVNLLNLKNNKEWRTYCSSGRKPENIPSNPNAVYKNKGWKGFGDWLGTGRVATHLRKHRTFEDARKFSQSLQLGNQYGWSQFCKSDKKPTDIPQSPYKVYKKEWISWGDWLGTGTVASQVKAQQWLPFSEAKKYVHTLQLSGKEEWSKYCKSNKRHLEIPASPDKSYKNKGWKDWGDWLGTGTIAPRSREYRSFDEAREFTHSLKLKNQKSWLVFSKSNKKPNDIPKNPNQVYKDKGWSSWGDWTGSGSIGPGLRKHRSFKKAREFAHTLGLTGANEWRTLSKTRKIPKDIPYGPNLTYKHKGWVSWGDFLGTGTISPAEISKQTISWKEAKLLYRKITKENKITTRKQWEKYVKIYKLPKGLPPYPASIYTKERARKMIK